MILNEVFNDWAENKGIFEFMTAMPWAESITSAQLNIEYFGNHSGCKLISPLVKSMLVDGVLSDAKRQALAQLISSKFSHNWTSLWNALSSEYNPIHNYDMTETQKKDGENIDTRDLTDTRNHGRKTADEYSHYGINSTKANPSDVESMSESGATTDFHTGDETHHIDETLVTTRSGNIGVTTSQQMIEAEIALRMKSNFYDLVYRDCDSVLALQIYDVCKGDD